MCSCGSVLRVPCKSLTPQVFFKKLSNVIVAHASQTTKSCQGYARPGRSRPPGQTTWRRPQGQVEEVWPVLGSRSRRACSTASGQGCPCRFQGSPCRSDARTRQGTKAPTSQSSRWTPQSQGCASAPAGHSPGETTASYWTWSTT